MKDTLFAETLIRQANPRPTGTRGPDVEWSPADLLSLIEQRSETMEIVETTETQSPRGPRQRRPLLVAAAALAVVVIVGAVVFAFAGGGSDTDVVEPTPTTLSAPTTVPSPTTQPPVTTVAPTTVPPTTAVATTVPPPQIYEATLTWDGETCTFDGPTEARVGDVLSLAGANSTSRIGFHQLFYFRSDATLEDAIGYVDNELGNFVRYGETAGWTWFEDSPQGLMTPPLDLGMIPVAAWHNRENTSDEHWDPFPLKQAREHVFVCAELVEDGPANEIIDSSDRIIAIAPQTIQVSG